MQNRILWIMRVEAKQAVGRRMTGKPLEPTMTMMIVETTAKQHV
jgi:hypothetical protein